MTKHSYCAGGVVVNQQGKILVVSQNHNSWSLPKGHIDPGEDVLVAAKREIYEESGIADVQLVRDLGSYDRYKIGKHGIGDDTSELKTITMFLFTTTVTELKPLDPENPEARWVPKDQVASLLTHPKDKEFFQSIQNQLIS